MSVVSVRLLVIAAALSGLLSCSRTGPAPAPARIVFAETAHDFGRVVQGTRVTHTYVLRNAGGLDLTIDNARAACRCTVSMPSRRIIPPGAEAAVEVVLDTSTDFGRKERSITVYSNDPAQPVTTLRLVGEVEAEVAADPPELYVGHVRRGQTAPTHVRLVSADPSLLRAAESRSRIVDATLRMAAGDGQLVVTIKPDAPVGRFTDVVTIRTGSTRRPNITVPIAGIVDAEPRG